MAIVVVRLDHESGANAEVCMEENEMRELAANAFQAIRGTAESLLPGHPVERLTYVDDEGDHCTLSAETIVDALCFAEKCEEGISKLQLRVVATALEAAISEEAPAVVPAAASAPTPALAPAPAPLPEETAVHAHVVCDISGMFPIVGKRYKKKGEDYDLCEAEFNKLSEEARAAFVCIARPGAQPRDDDQADSVPKGLCPKGHMLADYAEPHWGVCDGCGKSVTQGEHVMDCRSCNWYLCRTCHPGAETGPEAVPAPSKTRPERTVADEIKAAAFERILQHPDPAVQEAARQALEDAAAAAQRAAAEEVVSEVEGHYECKLYDEDGKDKNDWHFTELRRSLASSAPALTWSNRAGVTWTLTPSLDAKDISKLLVAIDCPYFEAGHQVCAIQRDDAGRLVGLLGPGGEIYSRTTAANEPMDSASTEKVSTVALSNEADDAGMVEVASPSVDTFSDVSSEPGQEEPSQAPTATVLAASLEVGGDQPMFEDTELRGDATEEFRELLEHYPNVTQAYRLGCVALSLGAGGDCAGTAVSKIIVKNTGSVSWSEASSLRSVAGPHHGLSDLMLGAVLAGDKVEILLDLAIKDGDGGRSAWAMCDGLGEPFGPLLIFEAVFM